MFLKSLHSVWLCTRVNTWQLSRSEAYGHIVASGREEGAFAPIQFQIINFPNASETNVQISWNFFAANILRGACLNIEVEKKKHLHRGEEGGGGGAGTQHPSHPAHYAYDHNYK